jgi:isopentenyl diphosphate isomerase/L-lactate dehydrogenase-like FMN-dependent dehydrogenase
VAALIQQLAAETDLTLALIGASSIRELDSTWIAASS